MRYRKIVFVAAILVAFAFNTPGVGAITAQEINDLIAKLQAQIVDLQKQLAEIPGQEQKWCHTFNTNLRIGDNSAEVGALRSALVTEGFPDLEAMGGAYGFDERIASAVVGFQEKYQSEILAPFRLTRGTGFVGNSTRAKLNRLYGCSTTTPTPSPVPTPIPTPSPAVPLIPSITVLSPNGGQQPGGAEEWVIGNSYDIKWTRSVLKAGEYIGKIDLYKGDSWYGNIKTWNLIEGTPTDKTVTETALWKVGDMKGGVGEGSDYKVYVKFESTSGATEILDVSNSYFSIVAASTQPSITVVSPNGGETWEIGNSYDIQWSVNNTSKGKNVNINLVDSSSQMTYGLSTRNALDGAGSITVPSHVVPGLYKITVSINEKAGASDESDGYVRIVSSIVSTLPLRLSSRGDTISEFVLGNGAYKPGSTFVAMSGQVIVDRDLSGTTSLSRPSIAVGNEAHNNFLDIFKPDSYKLQILLPSGYLLRTFSLEDTGKIHSSGYRIFTVKEWLGGDTLRAGTYNFNLQVTAKSESELQRVLGISAAIKFPFVVTSIDDWSGRKDGRQVLVTSTGSVRSHNWVLKLSSTAAPIPAPEMVYPANGQVLTYGSSNPYLFKVKPVAGASGYLFGFFQNGTMVYENWRDDKRLSTNGDFGIWPSNPFYSKLQEGDLEVWVRAYVNNQWSEARVITVKLAQTAVPSITVVSPNGGEKWEVGKTYTIQWKAQNVDKVFARLIHRDDRMGMQIMGDSEGVSASTGEYRWTVSESALRLNSTVPLSADQYEISISGGRTGGSSGYFSIVSATSTAPSITSVSPVSATSGDTITVYGKNLVDTLASGITIEFLKDGIQKGSQSSGIFTQSNGLSLKFQLSGLFVENSEAGMYQIRVVNANGQSNTVNFTIVKSTTTIPSITVVSPNGGERLVMGNTYQIQWKSIGIERLMIGLQGPSSRTVIADVSASVGQYSWTAPTDIVGSTSYKILIGDAKSPLSDESDNYFSIVLATIAQKVPPCGLYGDINNDGYVTRNDAVQLATKVLLEQLDSTSTARGDVNKDGKVDGVDTKLIEDYAAGLISTLPSCTVASRDVNGDGKIDEADLL